MERTNQLLAICLLCVCLAVIALTLGLVFGLRKDDDGGGGGGGGGVGASYGDDFIFGSYNYENFPHDEINTLPAFVNGSASASVSRGTTFGSFAGENSHGEGTKVLGRYCKLNFKLTKGRRPVTSEVEALMNVTALFLDDQISDAWTINYVDVELKDVFLPTRAIAGVALYDWSVSFNTQVWAKSSALQDRNDLADLMEGLDWQGDYRTNYATGAIVPSTKEGVEDWDIFATATQVTYEKASPPRPPGRGERQLRSYSLDNNQLKP